MNISKGCTIGGTEVKPVDLFIEDSDPAKRNKIRLILAEGKNREVCTAYYRGVRRDFTGLFPHQEA